MALAAAGDEQAGAQWLGQDENLAWPGGALAQELIGVGHPDHGQAVLRLGIADRVAAGERPACLTDLGARAGQDLGQHLLRELLGEGCDRQGE